MEMFPGAVVTGCSPDQVTFPISESAMPQRANLNVEVICWMQGYMLSYFGG